MKRLFTIFALSLSLSVSAEGVCQDGPLKVGVIDTGFGYKHLGKAAKLCQEGHKDFSVDQQYTKEFNTKDPVPLDTHSHGTNIVGVIQKNAKDAQIDYCFVIIKYYSIKQNDIQSGMASSLALKYAADNDINVINYSGGGPEFLVIEKVAIDKIIARKGIVVAAAGNEASDTSIRKYYPGSYGSGIIVVGNLRAATPLKKIPEDPEEIKAFYERNRTPSSNYGTGVNRWEIGENVSGFGIKLTGTSQATAVATGKILKEMKKDFHFDTK